MVLMEGRMLRTQVECSQDQWDIYKLDPEYDCLVRTPPDLSVISKTQPQRLSVQSESTQATSSYNTPPIADSLHSKRRMSSPSPLTEDTSFSSRPPLAKKRRQVTEDKETADSDSEDEDDVEDAVGLGLVVKKRRWEDSFLDPRGRATRDSISKSTPRCFSCTIASFGTWTAFRTDTHLQTLVSLRRAESRVSASQGSGAQQVPEAAH